MLTYMHLKLRVVFCSIYVIHSKLTNIVAIVGNLEVSKTEITDPKMKKSIRKCVKPHIFGLEMTLI